MGKKIQEYVLTQADINQTTDVEFNSSTLRKLPSVEQIPEEFFKGNIYTQVVESIYVGEPSPPGNIKFNEGFDSTEQAGKAMQKFITAHIRSVDPSYEHKIAGIGFMISKILTITTE